MLDSPSGSRTALLVGALIAFSLIALPLWALAPGWLERAVRLLESKTCWILATLAFLAAFAALLLVNTAFPGYLDQAEPNIACVSWLVLKGAPLYHSFDSAARYSLLYGPNSYLPYVAALWIGGGATLSIKSMVLFANVVMIYFLWRTYRTLFDASRALVLLSLVLLFILVPRPNHYLFQARADVLIMSAMAVALFGATRRSGLGGPLALAFATAFILDAKASAFVYTIPLFAMLLKLRGYRLPFVVVLVALCIAVLPFFLPNVSAAQYVLWLRRATGHPSTARDLISTLRTLPILLAPLFLIVGPTPWRDPKIVAWVGGNRLVLLALGLSLAMAVIASTRIGAGSHHILPLVPVLGYTYAELYQASGGDFAKRWPWLFRYARACLGLIVVMRVGGGLMDIAAAWSLWGDAVATRSELRSLQARYPERKIAMGYGDTPDPLTSFRPEIVFRTNEYLVDEVALSDMSLDGMKIPPTTIAALARCTAGVWLIPKNQVPFMVPSTFTSDYPKLVRREPLFDETFRAAFSRHYRKTESSAHFDLWVCSEGS